MAWPIKGAMVVAEMGAEGAEMRRCPNGEESGGYSARDRVRW